MKKVGLVQINNSFSGQNYFPYSAGLLQIYAQTHCSNVHEYDFIDILYKRTPVNQAAEHLRECDIAGFSTYVWNERISLRIASELKRANPKCLIVFGGPQVPDSAEAFLRQHPFIDLVIHGEGEHIFTLLLQTYPSQDWSALPAISYLRENNFITKPKSGRFKTLDEIPSPYLSGVFDGLIQKTNEQWLALWETNRGCPFSCTFCDWGSATQMKVNKFDMNRLKQEIDWFSKHKIEFVFCCDANYGILERDVEITEYLAESKYKTGYPMAIAINSTKNATERAYKIQKLLADAGLNHGVTLSVQSMDKVALQNIKRDNISLKSYQELQRRFMKDGVETYSDMILALPGETYNSFVDGIDLIISNGQHNKIRFNNLSILPNAEMGNPEYQKKFGMVSIMSKVINMHGSLDELDDESIQEMQQLVIATDSMPKADWIKTRAICWMVAFLHFNKLLQIPLIVFHQQTKIKYKTIFESFMDENFTKELPILDEARKFFLEMAVQIQNGGSEFCQSKKWLNLFWPADEYLFIKLAEEKKINQFYDECLALLSKLQGNHFLPLRLDLNAVALNKSLLRLPFENKDEVVQVNYNIMEYYQAILENSPIELIHGNYEVFIEKSTSPYLDWNEWLQKVVWYGNKKGGYLHGNWKTNYQLPGHY